MKKKTNGVIIISICMPLVLSVTSVSQSLRFYLRCQV